MNIFKKNICALLTLFCLSSSWMWAGSVIAPFGSFEKTLLGNSDTWVSIPYRLPAKSQGVVKSVEGSVLSVESNGTWEVDEFSGDNAQAYYLLMQSGDRVGLQLTIESNRENELTLSDDAESHLSEVNAGDSFTVHPCWTLNNLFPEGKSIHATERLGDKQTMLLIADEGTEGIDVSAQKAFYYYAGGAPFGNEGWRQVGEPYVDAGGYVLDLVTPFIVRHYHESSTELTIMGEIPFTGAMKVLNATDSGASDTMIAHPLPFNMSLIESGLYQSGAFAGSVSPNEITDTLLVFDESEQGYNLRPKDAYFYLEQDSSVYGLAGWRKVGEPYVSVDNLMLFGPGQVYVIRKSAGDATLWQGLSVK